MTKKWARPVLTLALLVSGAAAHASGFSGNVGAVSEYMFRGIEGSNGAAVQGEIYYAWDQGVYAGAWLTNALSSTNKVDTYLGYETHIDQFTAGGGIVYRDYSEDKEHGTLNPQGGQIDFGEIFASGGYGPLSLTLYYTNDYFGTKGDALYFTGDFALPVNETINVTAQIGYNAGNGVRLARGQEYVDYSLTLEKKLEGDFSVSFAVVDSDRDTIISGAKISDDPKYVVGLRKDFTF